MLCPSHAHTYTYIHLFIHTHILKLIGNQKDIISSAPTKKKEDRGRNREDENKNERNKNEDLKLNDTKLLEENKIKGRGYNTKQRRS